VCGGDFEATLQPTAFGITTYIPMAAPDKVRLVVQVEAIRQ
jgi:polyisoprenoid-binding protein YceI